MTYTNFILSVLIDQETFSFLPGDEVPHVFIYLHVLIGCLLPDRHHPRHHDRVVNKSEVLPAWNSCDLFRLSLSTGCLEGVLLHKIQVWSSKRFILSSLKQGNAHLEFALLWLEFCHSVFTLVLPCSYLGCQWHV